MSQDLLLAALPEAAQKHMDPASPLPMRMMAAKGMAPLAPSDMVVVLCGLSMDADEKLAAAASGTLQKLPEKILGPALDGAMHEVALAHLVPLLVEREEMLGKAVLNRATPDAAIAVVAATAPASVADLIVGNQQRCLRSEAIVRAVAKNEGVLQSRLDTLFDFLARAGVIFEEMPEFAEALERLSPTEMQEVASSVTLPEDAAAWLNEGGRIFPTPVVEPTAESEQPVEKEEKKRVPVLKLISSLNIAQKVALAMRGNQEARSLLIRDANKMVASAAIRSPRITEQEVVAAAKSRSISDEVIRTIAKSKEMLRPYGVKVALANNPKTPLQTAIRLLSLLRANDLKMLAKSKGVSSALAKQAKRMVASKMGGNR